MPLLDIATSQASLQNHLSPLRAQFLIHCKVFSSPFTFGDEKSPVSIWKSFHFPKNPNSWKRTKLQIKAVATLEPKSSTHKKDGYKKNAQLEVDSDVSVAQAEAKASSEDTSDVDEKELLRRTRISKANKGNTPWNKGRKHSPETLRKIRERTKLAMQNPKVRMKLANLGHSQSEETRSKIGVAVRSTWRKRREKLIVQETCYYEWQNLIADASRRGYVGEEEMQWDSYKILSEKLEIEWVESIEHRKTAPRPKGSKRAPKSPEQRRKIAEAIAAKWADPEYRQRVCSALSKFHGSPVGEGRRPRRRPSVQPKKREPTKRSSNVNNLTGNDITSSIQIVRPRSKAPVYKDPMAKSKLQMLKNIKAQRTATETQKTEAIERARLLIDEAEKAAEALEFAATKSPIARASLIETRKLIAEAIQLLESTDSEDITSKNDTDPLASAEPVDQVQQEIELSNGTATQTGSKEANGTKIHASSKDEDLNLTNLSLLNGENGMLPSSYNGYSLPAAIHLESLMEQSSSPKKHDQVELNGSVTPESSPLPNGRLVKDESASKSIAATKKWVRGRLVEVTEGD
ncbi:uncharacterized protein [Euphorbia lathyris]|uniref:uncharacterized protein n=1 Tax=Euphorbia lathyris TaxID=212925 RepID=UPI00331410D3